MNFDLGQSARLAAAFLRTHVDSRSVLSNIWIILSHWGACRSEGEQSVAYLSGLNTCETSKASERRGTQPESPRFLTRRRRPISFCVIALLTWLPLTRGADVKWTNLSSRHGDLPAPGESTQQTGNLIADFDKDGVKDFVVSFRAKAPGLVWYRRTAAGWDRDVIERQFLTV